MTAWDDEIKRLRRLLTENRKRIRKSRKVIAEFRETLRKIRADAQPRRDALNPKIIPLSIVRFIDEEQLATTSKKMRKRG